MEPNRTAATGAELGTGRVLLSWLLEFLASFGWLLMWAAIFVATISFAFISVETLLPK